MRLAGHQEGEGEDHKYRRTYSTQTEILNKLGGGGGNAFSHEEDE